MKEVAFVARVAGTSEEYGVLTTGVAENPDGTGISLMFMSPLPLDPEQEMSVCNENQAIATGGVSEIQMDEVTLRILFRPGVGRGLGLSDDTLIELALDETQWADLREGLRSVLDRSEDAPRFVATA